MLCSVLFSRVCRHKKGSRGHWLLRSRHERFLLLVKGHGFGNSWQTRVAASCIHFGRLWRGVVEAMSVTVTLCDRAKKLTSDSSGPCKPRNTEGSYYHQDLSSRHNPMNLLPAYTRAQNVRFFLMFSRSAVESPPTEAKKPVCLEFFRSRIGSRAAKPRTSTLPTGRWRSSCTQISPDLSISG